MGRNSFRNPLSAERLLEHAKTHTFELSQFDFATPIDRRRLYVCPTLTPLFYTNVYNDLTADQTRRYNQITALSFGELIGFFEGSFERALHALRNGDNRPALPCELKGCVEHFIEEESKHREMWIRLAKLSEPNWYVSAPRRIVRINRTSQCFLNWLTRRPNLFPAVVWVMLALEEHSLEISRRCAKMPADQIEPRYIAIYRAHMEEEVRHVQVDWHLLLHLMQNVKPLSRRINGWLFRRSIKAFFLKPTRAAVQVIDVLLEEYPELRPLRPRMITELKGLEHNQEYRRMMLSRQSTPITFELMDRYPELNL